MYTIEIRVVDRHGTPVEEVDLYFYDDDENKWVDEIQDTADSDGEASCRFYDWRAGHKIYVYAPTRGSERGSFIIGSTKKFTVHI
jgi:hypothetical protein